MLHNKKKLLKDFAIVIVFISVMIVGNNAEKHVIKQIKNTNQSIDSERDIAIPSCH